MNYPSQAPIVIDAAQMFADPDDLHQAAFNGDLDGVLGYLARGADPNERNPDYGDAPLFDACQEPDNDPGARVVRALLEHGADAHARNDVGNTPAHRAAENGHLAALELLAQAGADMFANNDDNRAPADLGGAEVAAWFAKRKAGRLDARLPAATQAPAIRARF